MSLTDTIPVTDARPDAEVGPGPSIDLTDRAPGDAPAPQSATSRPTFTITDAAAACAVSRKTITRKLADLALHGAAKDDDGIWRIPVEALLAVGLHPGRSLPSQTAGPRPSLPAAQTVPPAASPMPAADPALDVVSVPRQRWDDLRIRLARAEAEASERALALADARLALRALTAGPPAAANPPAVPSAALDLPSTPDLSPGPVDVVAGTGGPVAVAAVPAPALGVAPATQGEPAAQDPSVQVAAARSHAAQNGGYVPAAATGPVRKRRWWQSK